MSVTKPLVDFLGRISILRTPELARLISECKKKETTQQTVYLLCGLFVQSIRFSYFPVKEIQHSPSGLSWLGLEWAVCRCVSILYIRLQKRNVVFGADAYGVLVPETGLDFADVGTANQQHTQARLTDTAADSQGQLTV